MRPPAPRSACSASPRRTIRSITVIGSVSGRHPGRLRSYASAAGASYLLDRPLAPGETVSPACRDRRPARRSPSASPSRGPGVIGPPINIPRDPAATSCSSSSATPLLLPPKLTVNRAAPGLAGDIFLTPLPGADHPPRQRRTRSASTRSDPGGPMIVGPDGRLVWFHQLTPPERGRRRCRSRGSGTDGADLVAGDGLDLRVRSGRGRDRRHQLPDRARPSTPATAIRPTSTSFRSPPTGSAFMIAAAPVRIHLPGTPAGTLSPLAGLGRPGDRHPHRPGHVGMARATGTSRSRDSDVTLKTSPVYDAYHFNSLNPLPGGRILISARDTSAIYSVRQAGGADPMDARRPRQQLPDGPGARLPLPARRAAAARRPDQPVRRPGRAARLRARLARADPGPRPAPPPRHRGPAVPPGRSVAGPQRGQHADPARGRRAGRLRSDAVDLAVLGHRPAHLRRVAAGRRRQLPRRCASPGTRRRARARRWCRARRPDRRRST